MAGNNALTVADETRIVALLATGLTYKEIKAQFEGLRPLNLKTIAKVKERNKENLEMIKQRMLEREEADALAIKQKANKLISKRLDQADDENMIVAKANQEYLNNEMPHEEYVRLMKTMKPTSLPELVSVSKEMHNQSSAEPVKETPHKDLQALTAAIRSGDEVRISEIVFSGKDGNGISQAFEGTPLANTSPGMG